MDLFFNVLIYRILMVALVGADIVDNQYSLLDFNF